MLDRVTVQTRDSDGRDPLVVKLVNVFSLHRCQAPQEASAPGLSFLLSLTVIMAGNPGHVIGHKAR